MPAGITSEAIQHVAMATAHWACTQHMQRCIKSALSEHANQLTPMARKLVLYSIAHKCVPPSPLLMHNVSRGVVSAYQASSWHNSKRAASTPQLCRGSGSGCRLIHRRGSERAKKRRAVRAYLGELVRNKPKHVLQHLVDIVVQHECLTDNAAAKLELMSSPSPIDAFAIKYGTRALHPTSRAPAAGTSAQSGAAYISQSVHPSGSRHPINITHKCQHTIATAATAATVFHQRAPPNPMLPFPITQSGIMGRPDGANHTTANSSSSHRPTSTSCQTKPISSKHGHTAIGCGHSNTTTTQYQSKPGTCRRPRGRHNCKRCNPGRRGSSRNHGKHLSATPRSGS